MMKPRFHFTSPAGHSQSLECEELGALLSPGDPAVQTVVKPGVQCVVRTKSGVLYAARETVSQLQDLIAKVQGL